MKEDEIVSRGYGKRVVQAVKKRQKNIIFILLFIRFYGILQLAFRYRREIAGGKGTIVFRSVAKKGVTIRSTYKGVYHETF